MQLRLSLVLFFTSPAALVTAQSCPPVHIFGARGTTVPQSQGYDLLLPLGGQIIDNALCGGPDPNAGITSPSIPISASAAQMVKAAIFMGDPRFEYGASYEIGTCRLGGFAARPKGFVCSNGSKIQSYCDSPDPYCCQGNNASAHGAYVNIYGQNAISFIESKLNS
ncbi:acetylxylan esterase 2 precursor [Trichoderma harzianum]|uniref:Acetylxylan esterase 2 n=1 Tax=Trichoderma harzianum TaxID=5544 RepID=A0A0F9XGP4_TRIHA|nr:acetylxylan esterase 2 precursor [Trichoderma harzianum]